MGEIINIIMKGNKYMPDVVSLQEVTSKSMSMLEKSLSNHYFLFDVLDRNNQVSATSSIIPFSNVICVSKATMEIIPDTITAYDFDSQMGRKLMVCGVKHISTDTTFYILNVHLESYEENWSYRRAQMESVLRLVKEEKMKNIILMGDFNITHPREPIEVQLRLSSGYQDVWNEMGSPESLKYTYNSKTNEYAKSKMQQQQSASIQSRMDRILYKFKDSRIIPIKIKLLGVTNPQPSDHFGILAEFILKNTSINIASNN
jgi:endonuclease/exonuclease/phosphatase family metal-dependent hydrolase